MRRHNTFQNLKFLRDTIYRRDHGFADERQLDAATRRQGRRLFGTLALVGAVTLAPAVRGCIDSGSQLFTGNPNEPTEEGAVTPRTTADADDVMPILDCGQLSPQRPPTPTELQAAGKIIVLTGGEWAADFNCLGIDPTGMVASVTGASSAECAFVDRDTALCS